MLKFYSASTATVDSRRAMSECIENAFCGEKSNDCDLLIIYSSIGHNFRDLLNEAGHLCPSAQIVGCTGAGVIGREGPNESMRALAVMGIRGPKNLFAATGRNDLRDSDYYKASREMAAELRQACPTVNMVFLHHSLGLFNSSEKFISGIESVFGNVPIMGGVSMDNVKMITGFQFLGQQIFESGCVMIGLGDPELEVLCQANHGFDVIGDPFLVTKKESGRIIEMDGKPAWKRWTERLGLPVSTPFNEILPIAPLAIELPREYQEEYESEYILFGSAPMPDNSLNSFKNLTEVTEVRLARRNENQIHDGAERMLIRILDRLDGRKPEAVFQADCAVRGKLLFNKIIKEELISQIQFPICRDNTTPWFGLYGGSEYAPVCGKNMVHSYTACLYVIVKRKPEILKVVSDEKKEKDSVLFRESKINNIELKSRFIRSATWLGAANMDGTCAPENISRLLPVARSGAGLIMSEMLYVSAEGICMPRYAGISDDRHLPGLKRMTDFVHRAGCPILAQLNHGGLMSVPALTGTVPAGPSPMQTAEGITGREMTIEDIESVIVQFAEAAKKSVSVGFDGVQVHAAHGYLLNQFLSPFFNKRRDEYGGTLENRSRLLLRVVNEIRESIGTQKALLVKINSDDLIPGGFSTGEMIEVAGMLENAGIDAIEISGGTSMAFLMGDPEHSPGPRLKNHVYYRDAAMALKKKVNIPVILVGGIRTFAEAEDVISNEIADYISLSRPLIREPDLISKWRSGNPKAADCISEGACLIEGIQGRGVHCIHVQNS